MQRLDKVVIVTGGSRGLGLCIVKRLLAAGYAVAACSRSNSPAPDLSREFTSATNPEQFLWSRCEIGQPGQEEDFFRKVRDWRGARPLHGLVNNAAVAAEGVLAILPIEECERVVSTNLTSAIRLCRLAAREMLEQKCGGRIINISSVAGIRGYSGLAPYAASKAGLDGLTRALARELGPRQITVNSVAPGFLDTTMSATLTGDQREKMIRRTPLGRVGTLEDVANLVHFLLGQDSSFITGQTLVIDGGLTC